MSARDPQWKKSGRGRPRRPEDAERMVSTQTNLTPDQVDALRALSKRTRVPVAVYIREGVDHIIALHADPKPAGAP